MNLKIIEKHLNLFTNLEILFSSCDENQVTIDICCKCDKSVLEEIKNEYKDSNIEKRFHPTILFNNEELELIETITCLTEKEFSLLTAGDIEENDVFCSFAVKSEKLYNIISKLSLNSDFKTLDIEFNENDFKKEIKSDVVTFYFEESKQKFIVCNKEDNLYCDSKEIINNKQLLQESIEKEMYYLEDCKFIDDPKAEVRENISLNNISVKNISASKEMYGNYRNGTGIYSYNWYYDKNDIKKLLDEIMKNDDLICYSKIQEQKYNICTINSSYAIFCGDKDKNL